MNMMPNVSPLKLTLEVIMIILLLLLTGMKSIDAYSIVYNHGRLNSAEWISYRLNQSIASDSAHIDAKFQEIINISSSHISKQRMASVERAIDELKAMDKNDEERGIISSDIIMVMDDGDQCFSYVLTKDEFHEIRLLAYLLHKSGKSINILIDELFDNTTPKEEFISGIRNINSLFEDSDIFVAMEHYKRINKKVPKASRDSESTPSPVAQSL